MAKRNVYGRVLCVWSLMVWASNAVAGYEGDNGSYRTRFEYVHHFSKTVDAYRQQMKNKQELAELDELALDGRKKVEAGRIQSAYLLEYFSVLTTDMRPALWLVQGDLFMRVSLIDKHGFKSTPTCLPSYKFAWKAYGGFTWHTKYGLALADHVGTSELLSSTLYKAAQQEAACFSKLVRDYTQAGAPSCVPVEQVQACLSEKPLATMYPLEKAK